MDDVTLARLAELAVDFGANVQPGQRVHVGASIGQEGLARAVAARCYRAGAVFVHVSYADPWVQRARLDDGVDEALGYEPGWIVQMMRELGEERGATISLSGPTEPHLFDDLDPERLGRDVFPRVKEWTTVINERTVNWCVAPCPTPVWAELVHPGLEPEAAFAKLWEQVEYVCRLDEDDPVSAWTERNAALKRAAERLTAQRFDALHFEGPGTDLTIGLLPTSRWVAGTEETVDGIEHLANLPTEEVFTSPDPERVEGVVRATKPLYTQGRIIEGLSIRFEGGRAIQIDADNGAETLRALVARDEGGARLGEVALVDASSRIGRAGRTYFNTLLDENAAAHIAFGAGFPNTREQGAPRVNDSVLHLDVMIGTDDFEVVGIAARDKRVPLIAGGEWAI
jgi:aminopeptidase